MSGNAPSHQPIRKLGAALWEVTAPTPRSPIPRRMTVVKLSSRELVVHSAVRLDEPSFEALEEWGHPAYLLVPNGMHRIDAPFYKERYPNIRVLCPGAARRKVEERVPVDGDYGLLPEDPVLRVETLRGSKLEEGVLVVSQPEDGVTLVFNDTIFNLPERMPGFAGLLLRWLGSAGGPKVTRIGRWLGVADGAVLAQHLRELAETPDLVRIVVSHGEIVEAGAADALRAVAAAL